MSNTVSMTQLDLRSVPPGSRYGETHRALKHLPDGGELELISDQDPHPIQASYQLEFPHRPQWIYLESGPTLWRAMLCKPVSHGVGAGSTCCGACSCN